MVAWGRGALMHLFLFWASLGCQQVPERSLSVRLAGVGGSSASVLLAGAEGERQGESWLFSAVAPGEHEIRYRASPCPSATLSYGLDPGEGPAQLRIDPSCAVDDQGLAMRWIPAGSFDMGSDGEDSLRDPDEGPVPVVLSQPYLIAETEVTQGFYETVMGFNPSERDLNNCSKVGNLSGPAPSEPAYCLDWYESLEFANALSRLRNLEECYEILLRSAHWKRSCNGYRLATEAEWEHAARGGESYPFAGSANLGDVAWTEENSGGRSHPVASKAPNAYGLHDMSGNVWEWVWDAYGDYAAATDPAGADKGSYRIMRGGCWAKGETKARVADRSNFVPFYRMDVTGLRLVRSVGPDASE